MKMDELATPKRSNRNISIGGTPPYHVGVIVLGDVGRSPRMQYHTLSLLQDGCKVSLIGYTGTPLIAPLEEAASKQQQLHVIRVQPWTPWKVLRQTKVLKPFYYLLRFMELIRVLTYALFQMMAGADSDGIDCLLVQNPPSIPSLLLSYLFCRWYGSTFIIDWHNLGFTMLTDLKESHWIRKLAYRYEMYFSQRADGHLCVTKAMEQFLRQSFHLDSSSPSSNEKSAIIQVLYDRPPSFFCRTNSTERVDLMNRLDIANKDKKDSVLLPSTFPAKDLTTSFPRQRDQQQRCALIISSTSWSPEEDFHILLDSLKKLDQKILREANQQNFPRVAVVVTGKGPQKSMYENEILRLRPSLTKVTIDTMWLQTEDYPKLLGCADLGISLHTSTSGIDLPIKIMDMFGCQVPVCAIRYSCITEVMRHGWNGMVFDSSDELANQIFDLLDSSLILESMRNNISAMTRWEEEWNAVAKGMICQLCHIGRRQRQSNSRLRRFLLYPVIVALAALCLAFCYGSRRLAQ